MKRRKFLLASGTAILGSSAINSASQQPAFALNFDLVGIEDLQPSEIDSILIDFQNFELIPKYADETSDATITITLSIEGEETSNRQTVSVTNGTPITKSDLGNATPIVENNIPTSKNAVNGEIRIEIEHNSFTEEYKRTFTITEDQKLNGLVGHWPLHEWSGVANDIQSGNDAQVNGNTTQGIYGRGGLTSYLFDGDGDYLNIGQPSELDVDYVTVSAWINPNVTKSYSTSNRTIFGDDWNGTSITLIYTKSSEAVSMTINRGDEDLSAKTATSSIPNNSGWHHVAGVFDGESITLYINGQPSKTNTYNGDSFTVNTTSTDYNIGWDGQSGNDRYFEGKIQDVRVYNKALTDTEVNQIYSLGTGDNTPQSLHDGSDSSALSRWDFTDSSSTGTLTDQWSGNDGEIQSATYNINGGLFNNSLIFNNPNGDGENVKIPRIDLKNNTSFTFSVWAKVDSYKSQDDAIIGQHDSDGNDAVQILAKDAGGENAVNFRIKHDGTWTRNKPHKSYPTNVWGHHVGVYDGESIKYYRNGTLLRESSYSKDLSTNDGEFRLGTWEPYTSNYFDGEIADARVFNRALGPEEIHQLYQWGTRGQDIRERTTTKNVNRLKAWWQLNETGGDTAYNTVSDNNGTIIDGSDSTVTGASGVVYGTAFQFDGNNDLIKNIGSIRPVFDSGPVAVSIWAYKPSSSTGAQYIFDVDVQRWNINYHDWASDTWSFDFYDGNEYVIPGPNIEDEWVHFVAQQKSNNNIEFYMNAELIGSESASSISPNSPRGPVIGANTPEHKNFDGRIDSVRIYNRSLTPQEIQYLYELGL